MKKIFTGFINLDPMSQLSIVFILLTILINLL